MQQLRFSNSDAAQRFAAESLAAGCGAMLVIDGDAVIVCLWDRV